MTPTIPVRRAGRASGSTPTTTREGGCRQVQGRRARGQPGLGLSGHRIGHGLAARIEYGMRIEADYLGMQLELDEREVENTAYFRYCAAHDFRLQACEACGLIRYPPGTACPWCACPDLALGCGRRARQRALLYAGASRHSAGVQAIRALPHSAGRPRHAEGQAD